MSARNLGVLPNATPTRIILTDGEDEYAIHPVSVRASVKAFSETQPLRLTWTGAGVAPVMGSLQVVWEIEYLGVYVPALSDSATLRVDGPDFAVDDRPVRIVEAEVLGRARDTYRVRLVLKEPLW